ncbi:hypothetical protein [Roseovarius pacificus]|uniref:hypothetical protein n=1 Tax=Roseovarius pacificus TaxID=337701 RepID=UPI0040393352
MTSPEELDRFIALYGSLESHDAKRAFFMLVVGFLSCSYLQCQAGPHGAFSDFRVLKDNQNCFAFKGAQDRLTCYFRNPAFNAGLFDKREVVAKFPNGEIVSNGEYKLFVRDAVQANAVLDFVIAKLT